MTAPIKTCDYCGATGEMPTFMNGETICYTCLRVLPKTLPEAQQELMRLRAVLAVVEQPAANFADAYQGAMEEVAIWKKRALEAEDLNRKFVAEINGPTYMGEPAHPKPDCGEAGHDEGHCGNRQCLPGAQPAPSVPMDVIADYLVSISAHLARRDDAKAQAEIGELLKMIAPAPKPAPSVPPEEAAAEMGANGGHVVEAERLAFEAWMRGHCWKLGAKWTGTEYRSAFEKGGMVDMHAMRTRELWAAWRDRAALAAAPEAKP